MYVFEHFSVEHLNEYHSCKSWRKNLIFFANTMPSVRYAAVALGLMYRNYRRGNPNACLHPPPPSQGWRSSKEAPLSYYNGAIQLVLDSMNCTHDIIETTATTLLVCYLFTCFDHLSGNDVQAMKHLRGGVELARNVNEDIRNGNKNKNRRDRANPRGFRVLIC